MEQSGGVWEYEGSIRVVENYCYGIDALAAKLFGELHLEESELSR